MTSGPSFAGLVELLLAVALGLSPGAEAPDAPATPPTAVQKLHAAVPSSLPPGFERVSTTVVHDELHVVRAVYTRDADTLRLALARLPDTPSLAEQQSEWLAKKREEGTVEPYRGHSVVESEARGRPVLVMPLGEHLLLAAVGLSSAESIYPSLDGLNLDRLVALDSGPAKALQPDTLAALLPAALPGSFTRTGVESGFKNGAPGARGTYAGDDGQLRLTIAHLREGPSAILPQLEGAGQNKERLFDETYRSHPAYESQEEDGHRLVLVRIGKDLFVSASTRDEMPLQRLYEALDAVQWDRLEALPARPGSNSSLHEGSTTRADAGGATG